MALLSQIIHKLEQQFSIQIQGNYEDPASIHTTKELLLPLPNEFHPALDTLYITKEQELPSFHTDIHLLVLGAPSGGVSPYLTTTEVIPIQAIMKAVACITRESRQLSEQKEVLYDALLNNAGMKGILRIAYSYLGNELSVCNASFSIIDCYPTSMTDSSMLEKQGDTWYLRLSALRTMKEEKLPDQIFRATEAFFFQSKYSDHEMIFCPVRINRSIIAYICILNNERPFTKDDLSFTNVLSGILSLEFQKNAFYSGCSRMQEEFLLSDLLEKQFDNPDYYINRFRQLGFSVKEYCYVLIIDSDSSTSKNLKVDFTISQLKAIFPSNLVAYYNNRITILISKDHATPFTESEERKLQNFLQFNHYIGVLSYRFQAPGRAANYYNQALKLLDECMASGTTSSLLYYEDHVTESILSFCSDSEFLQTAIHPDLKLLMEYDEETKSELTLTLETYLKNNRNALRASKELHIHKSTFFYRLGKITDHLSISLEDADKLYEYELSFHILRYLQKY
ncbi:regulator of polyketide synthase expression [Lachnospiraceae bacterium KM106-2]|nr:regulator of polyketide synthase expression [Lachnospiraceae bacterium KM106-2]